MVNETLKDSFIQEVTEAVRKVMPDAELAYQNVVKNNSVRLTGLTLKVPGENVAPIVYVDDLLKEIDGQAERLSEMAEMTAIKLTSNLIPEIELDRICEMKDSMTLRVVGMDANREMLKDLPSRRVTSDLVVYPVINLDMPDGGSGSIKVTKPLLGSMGLTGREALEIASHNMEQERCVIRTMTEVLGAFMPGMEPTNDSLYVISNERGFYGAALAFASSRNRRMIMEAVGDEYVILPSSVHEVLAVPKLAMKEGGMDLESLRHLVMAVNATQVSPEERLSDNIYIVGERLKIQVYDGRKIEQEQRAEMKQTQKEGMRI